MSVEIKEVTSKKELRKFVKFNIDLYAGNPYHVPGLIDEEMMTLDPKKNPAFEVCDSVCYLAYKDGKVVGRIAGIVNALTGIFFKAGMALGGVIPGFVLAKVGYDAAIAEQTPLAQQGILWLVCVIPAILLVLAMFIISKYELSDEKMVEINTAIEERHKSND